MLFLSEVRLGKTMRGCTPAPTSARWPSRRTQYSLRSTLSILGSCAGIQVEGVGFVPLQVPVVSHAPGCVTFTRSLVLLTSACMSLAGRLRVDGTRPPLPTKRNSLPDKSTCWSFVDLTPIFKLSSSSLVAAKTKFAGASVWITVGSSDFTRDSFARCRTWDVKIVQGRVLPFFPWSL